MKVLGTSAMSHLKNNPEVKKILSKTPKLTVDTFEKISPAAKTVEEKNLVQEAIKRLQKAISEK